MPATECLGLFLVLRAFATGAISMTGTEAVSTETVVVHAWHTILHSHTAQRLRRALRQQPGVVITSVPIHLRDRPPDGTGRAP